MIDLIVKILFDWYYAVLMAGAGAVIVTQPQLGSSAFKPAFALTLWVVLFLVISNGGKVA